MLDSRALDVLLASYPVFHEVPARLQHKILEAGVYLDFSDNQMVFDLYSACRASVMPVSGAIRVMKLSESGREIVLYRLEPGDSCIITVSCLLGDTPFMACGVAEGDLGAISIPKELFLQLIEGSHQFRSFVFRYFGQRLSQLAELIEAVAFQKLDRRLATLLLEQGPLLEVTHQMLASELGSVREVVSRILLNFKDAGAVELDRGRIKIVDAAFLADVAQVDM